MTVDKTFLTRATARTTGKQKTRMVAVTVEWLAATCQHDASGRSDWSSAPQPVLHEQKPCAWTRVPSTAFPQPSLT